VNCHNCGAALTGDRKRHVIYDGGHNVPREKLIGETLDWLDK